MTAVRFLVARALVAASLAVAMLPVGAGAQPPSPPATPPAVAPARFQDAAIQVVDETLESRALGRRIAYRVLLPAGYASSARRHATLYLLHGLTGSFSDWERRSQLASHLARHDIVVVMPEGENAWYTDSAETPADRFETYIATDLVEDVERKFRVLATRHGRAIAGLSMGGYGALKFALKRPAQFAVAGSLSGALMATRDRPATSSGRQPETPFQRTVRESLAAAFGPPGHANRAANDLFALAEKAEPAALPYLYLDCGTEDGLLDVNREFAAALRSRKIAYEFHEGPGAHTWDYWDRRIVEFLRVMTQRMPAARRDEPRVLPLPR
jgi:S-formylglutathione hydrolase FrmB